MTPSAIGLLIALLLRFAFSYQRKGSSPHVPGIRHTAPRTQAGGWRALLWIFLFPSCLGLFFGMLAGNLALAVPLIALLVLLLPWPTTRYVLIPLGLSRAAYHLASLSTSGAFDLDRRGGAAFAAAWALARRHARDQRAEAWVTAKLTEKPRLGGAGVFASGLLLARRGDMEGARAVIAGVREIDPKVCPPVVRKLAGAWLAAEGAQRGDWEQVGSYGMRLSDAGRAAWLLGAIARCVRLEAPLPSPLSLWFRWLFAPARRATLPLVRKAAAARDGADIEPDAGNAPILPRHVTPDADAFCTALSLHIALVGARRPKATLDDVAAVAQAWDDALGEGSLTETVRARARELGALHTTSDGDDPRSAIVDDLATAFLEAGLALPTPEPRSATATRVAEKVRARLLSEIEARTSALKARVDQKRALPAPDELREWMGLRLAYERGVRIGGLSLRRMAFLTVHTDVCSLGVWLFNERGERPLGNMIFHWLLDEAETLRDERAIALQRKNVACGV